MLDTWIVCHVKCYIEHPPQPHTHRYPMWGKLSPTFSACSQASCLQLKSHKVQQLMDHTCHRWHIVSVSVFGSASIPKSGLSLLFAWLCIPNSIFRTSVQGGSQGVGVAENQHAKREKERERKSQMDYKSRKKADRFKISEVASFASPCISNPLRIIQVHFVKLIFLHDDQE